MIFKHLFLQLLLRACVLLALLCLIAILFTKTGFAATISLLIISCFLLAWNIFSLINKTNLELTRFLTAINFDDFNQNFNHNATGANFATLHDTFNHIAHNIKQQRNEQQQKQQHTKAIIEHSPVPLISIHSSKKVTLWNQSARKLFGHHQIKQVTDLEILGDSFQQLLTDLNDKNNLGKIIKFQLDGVEKLLAVSVSKVVVAGDYEWLLSLQDIRSTIDATQLQAWQDLVKVLTHEIMNSITPVASLAKTASDLVTDTKLKPEATTLLDDLNDIQSAVDTVARRSDSLVEFVSSYRQLTRLPPAKKSTVKIIDLFNDLSQLFTNALQSKTITLRTLITPNTLELTADPAMLQQAMINLVKNAEQALAALPNTNDKSIILSAQLNPSGHVVIDVKDNGSGISDDIIDKVFVPLFTTKRGGSGIGLALTRQIIVAHGGYISAKNLTEGGAQFRIVI